MNNRKKKHEVPDLLSELPKPRRGRPPKKEQSVTAEQIAASMEKEGRFWLEQAKILRGKAKTK